MAKAIFTDTSHSNPSQPPQMSGKDILENKIREAVDEKHAVDQEKQEREEQEEKDRFKRERYNAERALGEFMGFTMHPTKEAEFKGASRDAPDCWRFRVGGLVFKLNRISSNVESNDHGRRLKRGDYSFAVVTEFERIYGSKRLRKIAEMAKAKEHHLWEWHEIKTLYEIATLRKEGKLEER